MTAFASAPPPSEAVALVLSRDGDVDHPILRAAGDIDVATSPILRAELAAVIDDGSPSIVTLDLSEVPFVDSSGLGVLVGALMRMRADDPASELRVVGAREPVRKVFDVTGLDELFLDQE